MMSIAVTAGLVGLACMIAGNIAKSDCYRGDTLREGFWVTDNDRVVRVLSVATEGTSSARRSPSSSFRCDCCQYCCHDGGGPGGGFGAGGDAPTRLPTG